MRRGMDIKSSFKFIALYKETIQNLYSSITWIMNATCVQIHLYKTVEILFSVLSWGAFTFCMQILYMWFISFLALSLPSSSKFMLNLSCTMSVKLNFTYTTFIHTILFCSSGCYFDFRCKHLNVCRHDFFNK